MGKVSFYLAPVLDPIIGELKTSKKLFEDETSCSVLDPGGGKTETVARLSWRTVVPMRGRKLNEVHGRDGSPIAAEGLKRLAKFNKIEEAIRGQSAGQCKPTQQTQTKPLMVDFEIWLKTQRSHISAKSRHGEKLGYIAKYMEGLKLLLDEGSVEMDGYSSVSLLKILYGRLGRPR